MMLVGIRRAASSLLWVLACSLSVLVFVSPARADPPDGGGKPGDQGTAADAEADGRLAEPFVLLLPSDPQATSNPEAYARWALTQEAGESRLEPFTTASGVNVLRPPDAPLVQPDPGLSGLTQREQSEPLLQFLRALSNEQRDLLCRGEVVNVTSASDTVARLLRHRRFGPQGRYGLNESLVADSPLLAAALEVVPTLRLSTLRRTMGGVCDASLHHTWEYGGVKHVQLRPDGATFWSSLSAAGARRERAPREWRAAQPFHLSGLSRDRTDAVLPDLLRALDTPGASVSMSDVNGTRLERLVEDLTKLTGIHLSVGDTWSSCVVYAKGGKVSTRAMVEAVFAAGRLGIFRLGDDDSLTVVANPAGGHGASFELDRVARDRAVPEVTEELRSLLDGALRRPYLADLPVPLSLFVDGYDGPVSELPEQEAKWVTEVVQSCQRKMANAGTPARDQGWLIGVEPITVRTTLVYHVTVGACVPFRKADPVKLEYVAADPPETYYTVLGASRDRPIYSAVTAVLRGY